MAKFAAFLRGINLGGRRVTNERFVQCFAEMGLEDANVFRASGNVVFDAPPRATAAALTKKVEAGLEKALGYDVQTFLRSADEMKAIAAFEPFGNRPGKLQVMLFTAAPAKQARDAVLELATDDDLLAFEARELYWLPKGRMTDSELDLKSIAKLTGPATQRTKGTLDQVYAKYF